MNTLFSKIPKVSAREGAPFRLYNMEYCSYCRKVQREAAKLGVNLKLLDVYADRAARERLLSGTGRTRVPVLGITDEGGQEVFLPESEDIIRYLREYAKKSEPG